MRNCTTQRRRDFQAEVFNRCESMSLYEKQKVYQGIRQIDTALNGKVYNQQRLSIEEYDRLLSLLNAILPE